MAYTPSTLSITDWSVPLSVSSTDNIADLDDTVNAIMNTNASSVKNHINTELAKLPAYLTAELNTMYANLGESMAHKWAEEAEDVEVAPGEYSAHHWALKAEAFMGGVTATPTEMNVLDGITSTTAELNLLHGVTASTEELNILDGVTATTAELNILDGLTASTAELNKMDGVTASASDINKTANITSGTYTPTLSSPSNLDSYSVQKAFYMKVGNVVHVTVNMTINLTASGNGAITLSLPTSAPFGNAYENIAGSVSGASGLTGWKFWGEVGGALNTARVLVNSDYISNNLSIRVMFTYNIV